MVERFDTVRFGYQPLNADQHTEADVRDRFELSPGPMHHFGRSRASKGKTMTALFKSPLGLTAAVLLAGTAFAGLLMSTYPSAEDEINVPIIKAEGGPVKTRPTEMAGMEIPFQDSTVYESMRSQDKRDAKVLENLLARDESSAGTAQRASLMEITDAPLVNANARADLAAATTQKTVQELNAELEISPPSLDTENGDARIVQSRVESVEAQNLDQAQLASNVVVQDEMILSKIEPVAVKAKPLQKNTQTQSAAVEQPKAMHQAGASPETLEFVRSVLDQKDLKEKGVVMDGPSAAIVEPAAGAASASGAALQTHYVQLASVTSASAPAAEWPKMQKKYAVLGSAAYRVQKADLGSRGVFYRIQAGPYSESQASSVCATIKAKTPGGCLVVRK